MRAQNQFREPPSLIARDTDKTILAGIRELAPEITARAAEIEAARRIPRDLVDRLKSIGLLRMFVPKSHGGLELALPAGLAVIAALARIDGSVGWSRGSRQRGRHFRKPGTTRNLRSHLSERAGRGDVRILPAGRNGRTDAGRLADQWPMAVRQQLHACRMDRPDFASSPRMASPPSACTGGRWFVGSCCRHRTGRSTTPGMRPGSRAPAAITSCCGTRWFLKPVYSISRAAYLVPGPLYPAVRQLLPLFHAAFSVGMAEGTLDELVALAQTGRQQFQAATPMREFEISSMNSAGFAPISARRGPCCRPRPRATEIDALAGTLNDEALLIEGTQAAVWISTTCTRVADACFALAGSSAVSILFPCSAACATFMSGASTPLCTNDNMSAAASCCWRSRRNLIVAAQLSGRAIASGDQTRQPEVRPWRR